MSPIISSAKSGVDNRGFILVFTSAFILAFTMLGLAAMFWSGADLQAADKEYFSARSFWLAEAGIQKAIEDKAKNNCTGMQAWNTATNSWGTCSGCHSCSGQNRLRELSGGKVVWETYANNQNCKLTSYGYYPDKDSYISHMPGTVIREVEAKMGLFFNYGIFSNDPLDISRCKDNKINTDIGSNGTISGDPTAGFDSTPNANMPLPPVSVPSDFSPTAHSFPPVAPGDYVYSTISGSSWTVPTGGVTRLHLTGTASPGSITVPPGAKLIIYNDKALNFGGGDLNSDSNSTQTAANLIIYGTTDKSDVSFSNNANVYAMVYLPQASLNLALNGTPTKFYGSFIADNITLDKCRSAGGQINSDSSTDSVPINPDATNVSNWTERNDAPPS